MKTKLEKLVLRGCDFVHIAGDGKETIVFTAASEEIAKAIDDMLTHVEGGGFVRGRAIGYKHGFKAGATVIGLAAVIAGYIAILIWLRKKSKEEKEEADAE